MYLYRSARSPRRGIPGRVSGVGQAAALQERRPRCQRCHRASRQQVSGRGSHWRLRFFFKAFLQVFSNLPQKCFFDVNLFVIELLILEWFLSNQPSQRKSLKKTFDFETNKGGEKNRLATKIFFSKKLLSVRF